MRFPDDVPELTDGVVTLRAHRPDDVDGVLEQCLDPESQRWTTGPPPYGRDNAASFVTEVVPAGWGEGRWAFAVETHDSDGTPRFCGTVELRDEGNRRAEITYGTHPRARGRGVVERGLRLLLEWGFGAQRLRTVIWWANVGNWASRRVAWRLGFSCDGTVERWLPQHGDLLDAWVGALHVDDARTPRHPWLTVPELTRDGVGLRRLRDEDVDRIVEACSDERTAFWMGQMPRPFTADDARHWLADRAEQLATGGALTWAVVEPDRDLLVAAIDAFGIVAGREAEIGFWTHPGARGRGVMTEACRLAVRHCLTPYAAGGLGLARVETIVAMDNLSSRHVVERNGFGPVGRERRALLLGDGSLADAMRYDLLAEDLGAEA